VKLVSMQVVLSLLIGTAATVMGFLGDYPRAAFLIGLAIWVRQK